MQFFLLWMHQFHLLLKLAISSKRADQADQRLAQLLNRLDTLLMPQLQVRIPAYFYNILKHQIRYIFITCLYYNIFVFLWVFLFVFYILSSIECIRMSILWFAIMVLDQWELSRNVLHFPSQTNHKYKNILSHCSNITVSNTCACNTNKIWEAQKNVPYFYPLNYNLTCCYVTKLNLTAWTHLLFSN